MLFDKTTISGLTVKNRIICSATHDGLADKNGEDKAKCIMCNCCGLVIEKEPTRCLYGKVK